MIKWNKITEKVPAQKTKIALSRNSGMFDYEVIKVGEYQFPVSTLDNVHSYVTALVELQRMQAIENKTAKDKNNESLLNRYIKAWTLNKYFDYFWTHTLPTDAMTYIRDAIGKDNDKDK